ncbi:MAG: neutral/alkaline non-lysosomal ceramidase N-terminal domain-containing protein [Planctomycetes bacterium]|nr:neutral/alkaline non-lysosomal ceramidase N-terminal domain-containing protein [Planctomycetota bacterium]
MSEPTKTVLQRRAFLGKIVGGGTAAALALSGRSGSAAAKEPRLEAGEGVVDTTPPLGIEMAGFHRPAGKERRIVGIRRPAAARALVLRLGDAKAAMVSLDICGVSRQMTARVQTRIAKQLGVPAANVRICATHTHSMPTFRYFRQWGAISPEYMASVETKIVRAVEMAKDDLAPAALYLGKSRAPGASNNRTTKTWKTDEQFTKDSTDAQRWLDTTVHVLHFDRGEGSRNLLWYHFSAHPVCYQDDNAGPDWPGLVAELVRQKHGMAPSYLQGHCGDVNAGDASHWIGAAEKTAEPVAAAITRAIETARQVKVDTLRMQTRQSRLPLDMERFGQWLAAYRKDPSKCSGGSWVDAGFAEDWFQSSVKRDITQTHTTVPLSAMQLGELGLVFHPSELYTCYGLTIRRDSPLEDTLVVGYTDDIIGYLPDPNAFKAGEYSAITVPKIIDLPPFAPTAARTLTGDTVAMLKRLIA